MTRLLVSLLAVLACSGCTSGVANTANITASGPVLPSYTLTTKHTRLTVTPETLYVLTDAQRKDFLRYYRQERIAHLSPNQRIYHYLEDILHGFTYNGETLAAHAALEGKMGNCLSLAVLTAALADVVGVPIRFQHVNTAPVFKQKQDVLLVSRHIRSILYDPTYKRSKGEILITPPRTIIDYFPSGGSVAGDIIEREAVTAMFFRNLAAQSLLNDDLGQSLAYADTAISQQPMNANSIGLMALLLNRDNNSEDARKLYNFAVQHKLTNLSLLDNYTGFLLQQGQNEEADALLSSYLTAREDNPYAWIVKGEQALQRGEVGKAQRFFVNALTVAPYLDDAFLGLAKTYKAQGDDRAARSALKDAISNAWDDKDKNLYQAKLRGLDSY